MTDATPTEAAVTDAAGGAVGAAPVGGAADDTVVTALTVNGTERRVAAPARTSLADLLRERLDLTSVHLGCEHGVCGACTVLIDGVPVRSCTTLAASCAGREVTTVEGMSGPVIDAVRRAFSEQHGLQCGFCTPGMLATVVDILSRHFDVTPELAARELSGNICRCTGYLGIVRAVCQAAEALSAGSAGSAGAAEPSGPSASAAPPTSGRAKE